MDIGSNCKFFLQRVLNRKNGPEFVMLDQKIKKCKMQNRSSRNRHLEFSAWNSRSKNREVQDIFNTKFL